MSFDSDPHNFNRQCVLEKDHILKPRSIDAECALYSDSSFRSYIDQIAPLCTLPRLQFEIKKQGPGIDYNRMEMIKVEAFTGPMRDEEAEAIGATVALMNFLGVVDLHENNFIFGTKDGNVVFAPVDLECIFQRYQLGTCDFFPPKKEYLHRLSGVSLLCDYAAKFDKLFPLKFLTGYQSFFNAHLPKASEIQQKFLGSLGSLPISRAVFRDTTDYYVARNTGQREGFSPEEVLQLDRGDIPYFFMFYDDGASYFWETEEKFVATSVPLNQFYGGKRRMLIQQVPEPKVADFIFFLSFFSEGLGAQEELRFKGLALFKKQEQSVFFLNNRAYRFDRSKALDQLPA